MGTGRIVNFSQSGGTEPKIMVSRQTGGVEVMGGVKGGPPEPVKVTLHEEVIVEGQDNIRRKKDGSPDLRFRNAPNKEAWDKIKRMDEDK